MRWADAAGEAAVQLAGGATLADVEGTAEFTYTNKETQAETMLTSILLTPIPITQDNLNLVVDGELDLGRGPLLDRRDVGTCA